MGRTGADFMDLAKPGLIKSYCGVNALSTFMEFLVNYATPETRAAGEACIAQALGEMPQNLREKASAMVEKVRAGARDVYV